jgi:hypothetical protein
MMKKFKNCIIVGLVMAIVVSLTGCANSTSSEIPHPFIAKPGADVNVELTLSDEVAETVQKETAMAYELDVNISAVASQIETAFDISLGKADVESLPGFQVYNEADYLIRVDENTGYWSYTVKANDGQRSNALITEDEAIKIASDFVKENELWSGELLAPSVTQTTRGGWRSTETIEEYNVYFFPIVDENAVLGVFRICVTVDVNGEIVDVKKQVQETKEAIPVQVKSASELRADLAKENYSASLAENLNNIEITECKLSYYADAVSVDGKTYLYPVYVLLGNGISASGEKEGFDVIVDAARSK